MYAGGRGKGTIRFMLNVPASIRKVQVAGDFSNWRAISMRRQKQGVYAVTVDVQGSGKFEYKYLLDGQWTKDPDNSTSVTSAFGENSVAQID